MDGEANSPTFLGPTGLCLTVTLGRTMYVVLKEFTVVINNWGEWAEVKRTKSGASVESIKKGRLLLSDVFRTSWKVPA